MLKPSVRPSCKFGRRGDLSSAIQPPVQASSSPSGYLRLRLPLYTRQTPRAAGRCAAAAFTLIELLVVVAIIAVLASLGFGAVQGALKSAKRAQARNDVSQLASAVKSYLLEYGRLPETGNEVAALTGANPKGIIFFEARQAAGNPPRSGLSGGELLDPWGNPYAFTLDDDYNNKVDYDGEEYTTTVVVASQGDEQFKISSVKDTPK